MTEGASEQQTEEPKGISATSPATLQGRWLLLARTAWVVVAITALAIALFSIPSSFEHYRTVCTAPSEVCTDRALWQPTPEGVRASQDVGLSLDAYALLNVAIDKIGDLVWFAVGALPSGRRRWRHAVPAAGHRRRPAGPDRDQDVQLTRDLRALPASQRSSLSCSPNAGAILEELQGRGLIEGILYIGNMRITDVDPDLCESI